MFNVRFAVSVEDLQQAFHLRWEVLRKDWNQPKGSEQDALEDVSFTAIAETEGRVVATGRIQLCSAGVAQIRYMAVHPVWQGKGAGKYVLDLLEKKAAQLGVNHVMLNARENAIPFYKHNGYKITGEAPTLYGVIRHVQMEKKIDETDGVK